MTLNQSQPVMEILKVPKLNKNYFIRSGQGSSSRYKVRSQGFYRLTLLLTCSPAVTGSQNSPPFLCCDTEYCEFIFHEFFSGVLCCFSRLDVLINYFFPQLILRRVTKETVGTPSWPSPSSSPTSSSASSSSSTCTSLSSLRTTARPRRM